MAGDKLTFHPRDAIGQELIARLAALEQENKRLRETLEKVENEACRGLDTGDNREALIEIKFQVRRLLAALTHEDKT